MRSRTTPDYSKNAKVGLGSLLLSLLVLGAFLILPIIAMQRRAVDVGWAAGYGLVLSALTWWAYASDKRRAQEGEWRLPEARLHLLELLGGWPGAWLAQRRLRHKTSKASYQIVFWLIVLGWQFVAFDSLQDWKLSRPALNWIQSYSKRHH